MEQKFTLNPSSYIETTDDGLIAISPSKEKVVFLKNFECMVFNKALGLSEKELIFEVEKEYEGDGIAENIHSFLHTLLEYEILVLA